MTKQETPIILNNVIKQGDVKKTAVNSTTTTKKQEIKDRLTRRVNKHCLWF